MDSEYLKQHVGEALAVGLSEIVEKRPVDPIEYLAHWLRKYVQNRDFDIRKKQEEAALEIEKQAAEEEKQRQMKMKEEAEAIARQEAYEKAAQEEVVVDTEPRPMPPEVSGTLPPVAEGDEEETERQEVGKPTADTSAKDTETSAKEEAGQLPTLSEDDENNENARDANQKNEQMEQIEETNETEESIQQTQQLNAETEGKTETEEQKDNQKEKGEEEQTAQGEQNGKDKPDATEEKPGDTTDAEKE